MAENSFKDIQDGANTLLTNIGTKIEELDRKIISLSNSTNSLFKGGGNTPSVLESQIKQIEVGLKKMDQAMKNREAQVMRESNLRESLYRQRVKQEQDTFKNSVKATQAIKKSNDELAKRNQILANSKAEREAKISKDLTQSMIAQVNAIGRTNDGLRKMNMYYSELEASSKKLNTQLQKEKQSREKAISKDMTNRMRESVDSIGKQSDAMKALNADYRKQEIESQKAAQAQIKLGGAYQQLITKQKEAKTTLQNLIVTQGKNSKATKQAQKEYDKYTTKVNQANKATSNFSKTGLGNLAKGFRNLLGAFGITGAIYMFAQFAKSGFELAKKLDSLNFAMNTIISDSADLIQTQFFLLDITERYGAEIVTTTERYIKFLAASQQSNISLKDTEQIFRSVTKAAGVLGLSTEELNGTYLALEQMLSKGKVTTEELRRQLGERLPGAFGIMANAIGVTTSELDKMLRAGEILSKDALPKFAKELEKAYKIENIDNVKTLRAETGRLSNAWTNFIGKVTESDGVISRALGSAIRLVTGLINSLNILNSTQKDLNKTLDNKAYVDQVKIYKELGQEADAYAEISKKSAESNILSIKKERDELQKLYDEKRKNTPEVVNAVVDLVSGDFEISKREINRLNNEIARQEGILKAANKQLGLASEEYEEVSKKGRTLEDVLKDLKKSQDDLNNSTKEEAGAILNKIDLLNKEKEAWERLNAGKREKVTSVFETEIDSNGTTETTNTQFKELEKTLKSLIDLYGENTVMGMELTKQLDKLYKTTESLNDINEDAREGMEKDLALRMKGVEAAEKEAEAKEALKEQAKDFMRTFTDDFFSNTGFDFLGEFVQDFDEISDMLDESEVKWAAWGTAIVEIAQEAFNFINQQQQAKFDAQYERLEREKNIAIQFAGESETARAEIDRQYEEKKKAIQREEAKSQKETALFNASIDMAQGILATISSVGLPAAIPLIALIGVLGAAQIAMISSQQIPQYWSGTDNASEGWAKVDEIRPEVHTDKAGNIKSFGNIGANMRYMDKGDKIYSSREKFFEKELKSMLGENDILPYNQMLGIGQTMIVDGGGLKKEDFVKHIRSLENTIKSKEGVKISIDKKGFKTYEGNTEILNNSIRLKSRQV